MAKIYGYGARLVKTNKGLAYVADYCWAPVDSPDDASPAIVDGHGLALCAAEDAWFAWQSAFDNVLAGVDAEIVRELVGMWGLTTCDECEVDTGEVIPIGFCPFAFEIHGELKECRCCEQCRRACLLDI